MNTVLIIGIIQAIFLGLLIINKKNKSQSDYILILMLIYMSLHQAFFLANFNEQISIPLPIMILGGGFPLLYGPILLWYVLYLIREKPVTSLELLVHLTPYLLLVISFFFFHYFIDGHTVSVYDGYLHIQGDYPLVMRLYSMYFAISGGGYPIASLILLKLHKRNIHRKFSYEDEINLDWLRFLILFTLISFLVGFFTILFIVDWQWNENPRMAFYIISVNNTIFIFVMGYFGLKQTTIFSPQNLKMFSGANENIKDNANEQRYAKSGLDPEKSRELFQKLDMAMKEEKLYLNGKLTLADLAKQMNTSTNHLSQAINENLEFNFFDYVNNYRIEEVKNLLMGSDYDHYTLLGIGLECGFNSKSSFNQIFKDQTGLTPSEYKDSLKGHA